MEQSNHSEDFQRKKKKNVDCLARGKVCDPRNGEEWQTHVKAAHFIYLSLACLPRRRLNTPGEGWDFPYVN